MHELSIAMSIVEIAEREAERCHADRVIAVNVRLGSLSGVVKDALLFSYQVACENTPLAGSQLLIEEVPAVIFCSHCNAQRPVRSMEWFRCPECDSLASEIVQGKELQVISLEVEP